MYRWASVFLLLSCALLAANAQPIQNINPKVAKQVSYRQIPLLTIKGAIGPAVSDYLVREISAANAKTNTPLILITLDTPGGLSASLRDINKSILSSTVPIACLVYPQGARAASAGTYILYACHVAAMASATTLGAATPVNIAAPMAPQSKDSPEKSNASSMEKKVLNDAIAYIRSLAQLRNRNAEWAEKAVAEAATLTADEALKAKVIDIIAETPQALISQLDGKEVSINQQVTQLQLANTTLVTKDPDWRSQFLATITDPNIAYILMLIGIYGLLLEFYSPGVGVAGVTGGISLLIAMYAFQLLPVNFVGVGLVILGITLLVVESLVPSFGVFGIGGVAAFVIGSIFLFNTELDHFKVSLPLIAAIAFISTLFIVFALGFIWRTRKNKIVSGQEEIINAWVTVSDDFTGNGYVMFNGERWAANSIQPVKKGQKIKVKSIKGLTLNLALPATLVNDKEQANDNHI
ncbi:NfeD family protein [Candidatus Colwellia aromaticivorans]|uniref:NfeD family protein n=1 Tax=Candidatus Colwellia aromaticivorans TaxID=2267621 RepID=UPI000DF461DB|nr:nodulation protein NfeD [Candidatus Colwellia aromaticivorans]